MNKVYVFGDLHGSYYPVRDFYNRYKDNPGFNFDGTDTIILLGDAGLNYYFNYRDDNFKKALCKYPFNYFVIRGNHEERPSICAEKEPEKWTMKKFWDNKVYIEKKYPKIKYALDYVAEYQIELDEEICSTLVIPGAYSIDKEYRLIKGWSWFPQEQLSLTEMFEGIDLIKVYNEEFDIVLSHTCPQKFEPVDLFLSFIDQSKVDKSMEEYLDFIEDRLKYKAHLWGHYHQYREYPRKIGRPSSENPRQLMLFNDYVVDLYDVMTNENLVNRL